MKLASLEPLESRIALASVSLIYTDIDGDMVKITASKPGAAAPLDLSDLTFGAGQLQVLTLTDSGFSGASIVFKVIERAGGDGLAHVGFINATGVDLNKVVIKGDLGKITAGDDTVENDSGLNLLQVRSMGTLGLLTQGGAGDLMSIIVGKIGTVKVADDFAGAVLRSITRGETSTSEIGSIFIGGDLIGGTTDSSGSIQSYGLIEDVRIGGSIIGGTGRYSGRIDSYKLGDIRVGGDLLGGTAFSGVIHANNTTDRVRIGGDVIGGTGYSSGRIFSSTSINDVRIGGNLIGGNINGTASSGDCGVIHSFGPIKNVTIAGSLIAGRDDSSGSLILSGGIVSGADIGSVKIGGSIVGHSTNPAVIVAEGQKVKPTEGFDTAINNVRVGGDVRFAQIMAGFWYFDLRPYNADASIGKVTVEGDWAASTIVAGAQDSGPAGFGIGDTLQTVENTALVARIASITIKGDAIGSSDPGDHFGFVAQQIDRLKIAGRSFSLSDGANNDNAAIPFTNDLRVLEVS